MVGTACVANECMIHTFVIQSTEKETFEQSGHKYDGMSTLL